MPALPAPVSTGRGNAPRRFCCARSQAAESVLPEPALLALADGTLLHGVAIGASGHSVGEVVFNTALTGYQEILTDPSYCRQIVTLTYPHIGNVGCNPDDEESSAVYAAGLVIRDLPRTYSSWRGREPLGAYLRARNVVAIAGLDTRALTGRLRRGGAQAGCIVAGPDIDADFAVAQARAFGGLTGMDLARVVSADSAYEWAGGAWTLKGFSEPPTLRFRVVAYDFGIKRKIGRAHV